MDWIRLTSGSISKLDRALGELIRSGVRSVGRDVEGALLQLIGHDDPEIRRQVVFLLGMRLRQRDALDHLIRLAMGEEADSEVVLVAIRSVAAIGEEHADLRRKSLAVLATIALDDSRAAEERGLAYLTARSAAGLTTALEVAQSPEDIERLKPDQAWLRSLIE